MEQQELTFGALEKRIEEIPEHSSNSMAPSRRARWGNSIGMLAGLSALILYKALPTGSTVLVLTTVLLVVEIVAFVVAWTAGVSNFNLRPSTERREYAEALDHDISRHLELIGWIRAFPRDRLEAMSAFATHRLTLFRSKLPLLTGSIEKLGFLPLATALVLQFKEMRWPIHLNWAEIILIGTLMLVYWLSMLQLGLRFRLELYESLLKSALADSSASVPRTTEPRESPSMRHLSG